MEGIGGGGGISSLHVNFNYWLSANIGRVELVVVSATMVAAVAEVGSTTAVVAIWGQ